MATHQPLQHIKIFVQDTFSRPERLRAALKSTHSHVYNRPIMCDDWWDMMCPQPHSPINVTEKSFMTLQSIRSHRFGLLLYVSLMATLKYTSRIIRMKSCHEPQDMLHMRIHQMTALSANKPSDQQGCVCVWSRLARSPAEFQSDSSYKPTLPSSSLPLLPLFNNQLFSF